MTPVSQTSVSCLQWHVLCCSRLTFLSLEFIPIQCLCALVGILSLQEQHGCAAGAESTKNFLRNNNWMNNDIHNCGLCAAFSRSAHKYFVARATSSWLCPLSCNIPEKLSLFAINQSSKCLRPQNKDCGFGQVLHVPAAAHAAGCCPCLVPGGWHEQPWPLSHRQPTLSCFPVNPALPCLIS